MLTRWRLVQISLAALALFSWLGVAAPRPAEAAHGSVVVDAAGDVGQYTSLVLDAFGNPVISYYKAGGLGGLRVLHCGNADCTSGNTIATPVAGSANGQFNSITLDAAGNPVISFFSFIVNNSDLKVLHCGNPTCTSGNTITTPDSSGDTGYSTSIALDASGNPVVSYINQTTDELRVLHCGDATCSFGNTINSFGNVANHTTGTSLTLDAVGSPVVTWEDNGSPGTSPHLWILRCGNTTCGSGNSSTSLSFVNSGQYLSVALNAAGNPVISHRDWSDDLGIVLCGNADCTSGNSLSNPDPGSDVGGTSLELNASGNPVVSYYDFAAGDLKVLTCGNPDCTSGNEVEVPDSADDVGRYVSMELDGAGNPVMSYYDTTNADLRVLHCDEPTCAAGPANPSTFVVDSADDTGDSAAGDGVCDDGSGDCTLRAAIEEANAHAGGDSIHFAIGSGNAAIVPASALPQVLGSVVIDARTQPGYSGTPLITLDGTSAGVVSGIEIAGPDSVVAALAIGGFAGSGIRVLAPSASIEGNYIGVNANGVSSFGNGAAGVFITGAGAVVGGQVARENMIAFNGTDGVRVNGAAATGNVVRANRIHENGGQAITLALGSNGQLAAPTIVSLTGGVLGGTACANCIIDIYSDDGDEGRLYHGSTRADGSGIWGFTGSVAGPIVHATATNAGGNTSEFSAGFDLIISALAGTTSTPGFAGDAGPAGVALLDSPRGTYEHTDGVIYFADTDNNRVRAIATDGPRTITTFAGSGSPPACGPIGDGGAATSAGLCAPRDVYVAANGDVYIADTGNCRVRLVSAGTISTVAGTGTCGYSGDGGAATSAQLNSPRGVALDASGNLYIADTLNHRVRKVAVGTGTITTMAGNGAGSNGGDLGPATQAELKQPHDVYVVLGNHLIIADTANNKLRRVYLPNGIITTFAGTGVAGSAGDGGFALQAQLNGPEAIAADIDGNVYIADTQNNKIRRVTFIGDAWATQQTIVTVAGTGATGSSGNGGPATSALLNKPAGVAVGSLVVADTGNETLREVETQVDPTGQPGGQLRPTTSCSQGSVANADMLLLLLMPGMVLFRRSIGRFLTMLAALLRTPFACCWRAPTTSAARHG